MKVTRTYEFWDSIVNDVSVRVCHGGNHAGETFYIAWDNVGKDFFLK
jgi:hypothetical protein